MSKVPLENQIDSVETVCENLTEAIDLLIKIAGSQGRIEAQILAKKDLLKELTAALNTLKWLQKNRETIIEVHRRLTN